VKFSGDDNRTTWEHISRYIAVMLCLFSCLWLQLLFLGFLH
jgi:hypothetical protein